MREARAHHLLGGQLRTPCTPSVIASVRRPQAAPREGERGDQGAGAGCSGWVSSLVLPFARGGVSGEHGSAPDGRAGAHADASSPASRSGCRPDLLARSAAQEWTVPSGARLAQKAGSSRTPPWRSLKPGSLPTYVTQIFEPSGDVAMPFRRA
jgi:hypothetical protein